MLLRKTVFDLPFGTSPWDARLFWGGKDTRSDHRAIGEAASPDGSDPNRRRSRSINRPDPAAVIFTTGSTGPPKGVLYSHGTFHAQIDRIRERYDIHRGSVATWLVFRLFGLFDAVMGVTTIIPDMDPTRPAAVDPSKLIEAAKQWEIDQAFGSPALWNTVVRWCEQHQRTIAMRFRRYVVSCRPARPCPLTHCSVYETSSRAGCRTFTRLTVRPKLCPIASIESREVIAETGPAAAKGKGVCVGTPFEGV